MAGFEGADHVNAHGLPNDMVALSGHADAIDDDFARLAALGLTTVRESIGWRVAEPRPFAAGADRFDFRPTGARWHHRWHRLERWRPRERDHH